MKVIFTPLLLGLVSLAGSAQGECKYTLDKEKTELKWTPKISINQLVKEMVNSEMKKLS